MNGRFHTKVTLRVVLPAATAATAIVTADLAAVALCAASVCAAVFVGPDLDIENVTYPEGVLLRWWRPLGKVFIWLFMPYALTFAHRSPFTHWPLLGTLVRLMYTLGFIALPWWLLYWTGLAEQMPAAIFSLTSGVQELAVFAGFALADAAHFVCDTRWFKRYIEGVRS